MSQKVFDIFPKKAEQKKKETKSKKLIPKFLEFKPLKISPKFFFFFSSILIFFFLFLLSFKFSKAEIKIWPKTEKINLNEKLVIDTKADKFDLKNKILPGKILEGEETFSEDFLATGKILKKAHGTIRLFNEYTTQNEIWKEGTRFVSSEGKLFKSKDKISVPGAKIEGGKIKASYVDVPVEAAEGGAEYNIGPSDFSIVALKGTPRYFKYYGKSFEPMKGGGEFPKLKKEDLENAEKSLLEKAKSKAKDIFESKIPEGFSILQDSASVEVLEKNSSAKEGDEVEKFNFQVKLKIKSIAFSKEEILNFAKNFISLHLADGKGAYFPSLKLDFKTEILNLDLGKATISLNMECETYPTLDILNLKKGLAGKNLKEVNSFLLAQEEFAKVKINLFPFWVKKFPENINQIDISYPLLD